jgi:murein DD-endopeptidase MepM/ murein hydrolase activator NlpD
MAIKLIYPVSGPITQNFGENPGLYAQWGYPGHNGIDFGIPNGTPVLAAAKGTVDKVSFEDGGYGNFVKLKHVDGSTTFYTYYAHLMQASVTASQSVEAGAVIGHSNNTGASTGPHLHFGLRSSDTSGAYKGYMDPMPSLTSGGGSSGDSSGAVALPNMKFEVIAEELNVRNGPGINYTAVGKLTKGKVVTATNLYSEGAWLEIEPGKWCAVTFGGIQNLKVK